MVKKQIIVMRFGNHTEKMKVLMHRALNDTKLMAVIWLELKNL